MADEKKPVEIVINASDECVDGVVRTFKGKSEADFTITLVKFGGFFDYEGAKGFTLDWETKSAGFGALAIYEEGGAVVCDNEAMGPDFVKEVLANWVDEMRMVWVSCDEHGKMMCRACRDRDPA